DGAVQSFAAPPFNSQTHSLVDQCANARCNQYRKKPQSGNKPAACERNQAGNQETKHYVQSLGGVKCLLLLADPLLAAVAGRCQHRRFRGDWSATAITAEDGCTGRVLTCYCWNMSVGLSHDFPS